MSWAQLVLGVELPFGSNLAIPELHPFELDVPSPGSVHDIQRRAYDTALTTLLNAVAPGMTVAVGPAPVA